MCIVTRIETITLRLRIWFKASLPYATFINLTLHVFGLFRA